MIKRVAFGLIALAIALVATYLFTLGEVFTIVGIALYAALWMAWLLLSRRR